jgi:hypothetical protein
MSICALFGLLAAAAAVVALVSGLTAMAADGEVRHLASAEWMQLRVLFQAIAALCVMLAALGATA